MKICFICNSIFSYGGVQKVLSVIAKSLSLNNDVTIITFDEESNSDLTMYDLDKTNIRFVFFSFKYICNYKYIFCKTYSALYKSVLPKIGITSNLYAFSSFPKTKRVQLIDIINQGNYDVAIGVHAFLSIKLATIRKQLNTKRVIGWMHNSYQAFFEKKPAYLQGLKSHFRFQMQKLDDVIVLTNTDANVYEKCLNLSPIVIYNPLTITPKGESDPKSKRFISIGRMSPQHKGFDILIEAFSLFAKENNEWNLDIVGDGTEKRELQKRIEELKLGDRIILHPFTNDIGSYYEKSSIYILSSRWEGLPLVLAEAMSYNLPIISSDIPVCKEIFNDKLRCVFFKNEDVQDLYRCMLISIRNNNLIKIAEDNSRFMNIFDKEEITQKWYQALKI